MIVVSLASSASWDLSVPAQGSVPPESLDTFVLCCQQCAQKETPLLPPSTHPLLFWFYTWQLIPASQALSWPQNSHLDAGKTFGES